MVMLVFNQTSGGAQTQLYEEGRAKAFHNRGHRQFSFLGSNGGRVRLRRGEGGKLSMNRHLRLRTSGIDGAEIADNRWDSGSLNLVQASHERRRLQASCPKRGQTDLRTGNAGKKYGNRKDVKTLLGSEDTVPLSLCTLV